MESERIATSGRGVSFFETNDRRHLVVPLADILILTFFLYFIFYFLERRNGSLRSVLEVRFYSRDTFKGLCFLFLIVNHE